MACKNARMTAALYFELVSNLAIFAAVFYALNQLKGILAMNHAQLTERLAALREQNEKASAEQGAALQKVRDELAAALDGEVPESVTAALDELAASIQKDDDQNPDAPGTGDGQDPATA